MNFEDILLFNNVEKNIEAAMVEVARPRREVLVQSNPFNLSDQKFKKYFRLTKDITRDVINMVRPHLVERNRRSALSAEVKVLATLKCLGFGSYQEITDTNQYISISQSSVSRSIGEVCAVLSAPNILNQWIKFPQNRQEMELLRNRFYQIYDFPGIVGVIGCTHVAIAAPVTQNPLFPEYIYVNRKNYHSLNVQLVCDENLKILNINARFPGSSHDAYIWQQSQISNIMENVYRQNPNNLLFLLGDSGYYLRPRLLTRLQNVQQNTPEARFNQRFCTLRSLTEQCNGVLKNRFRCILRDRVLHYEPDKAGIIVNATAVLHNMCIEHGVVKPERNDLINVDWGLYNYINKELPINRINADLIAARQLQRRIIDNHFL